MQLETKERMDRRRNIMFGISLAVSLITPPLGVQYFHNSLNFFLDGIETYRYYVIDVDEQIETALFAMR